MTKIIGLIGLSLSCMAAGIYFEGLKDGICIGIFVLGLGLFADAIKK
jgi:hypothetical protein